MIIILFVVADSVVRNRAVPTDWIRAPTARQCAIGIPLILVVAALFGGLLLLVPRLG